MVETPLFVLYIFSLSYNICGMGRYVYIDNDSKKGRFGIGVSVFETLANEAFSHVPGLVDIPVEGKKHRLVLNSSSVEIRNGVVSVKLNVNAKKSVDVNKLRERLVEEINSSFMMVAEQVPVQVKVNVENII